jgi:hypothetical protein
MRGEKRCTALSGAGSTAALVLDVAQALLLGHWVIRMSHLFPTLWFRNAGLTPVVCRARSARLADHRYGFLGDHQRGRVRVAARNGRHDRRISDPEVLDRTSSARSLRPASSSVTDAPSSSLSRPASTQPAAPAPTTT